MSIADKISDHFNESIQVKISAAESLSTSIEQASQIIVDALLNDNKIMCCGNGGSAADCQHFSAELLNRYQQDRPSLPAISLTTDTSTLTSIANDYNYHEIFAKQIMALGKENDILLAVSTSGNSLNIVNAIKMAHEKRMHIITLTGQTGGKIKPLLKNYDINISVPSKITAHVQETHITILHIFCKLIDYKLFNI